MTPGSVDPLALTSICRLPEVRASENGRWLLRANDGITGVVDHRGQIRAQLPQFVEGVLATSFQVMQGATPYR